MCLGVPGKIVSITNSEQAIGLVDVSGIKREVNLACVKGEQGLENLLGQWVLIHVGFAMSIIDEDEAQYTLNILQELGDLATEQSEMLMTGTDTEAPR